MEILKYKKLRTNIYELDLDNGSVLKLYDDTIIKYELLLNRGLDNKKLAEVIKYDDTLDAYYVALKYLNKKMRSHLEIKKYLVGKEFDKQIIDQTIKKLTEEGYLNQQKFIQSYISDQVRLTANGPDKIKYNLIKLGFREEEIVIDYDFSKKIETLINKKIKLNHKLSTNSLRINISNYLINLGYPNFLFAEYLTNIKVNDEFLIKKDYEILLKKYGKKYDKYKLNLFIRDKLYKKGYNNEEIAEVMNNQNFD